MLQDSDNLWWDAFATEFFEDDASLTLAFCLEDGPKRYSKFSVELITQTNNYTAIICNWHLYITFTGYCIFYLKTSDAYFRAISKIF